MNMISNCRIVLMDCITQALNMNTWVGFWHVIALSSVLKIPIQSIYPSISVGISSSSNVRYVLNRTIVPRSHVADITKTIMWTSTGGITNNLWTPNHFVPCLNYVGNITINSLNLNGVTHSKSKMQSKFNCVDDMKSQTKKTTKAKSSEQMPNIAPPKKQKVEKMCKLPCENKHNRSKDDNKKYEADINAFNSSIRLTPCNSCHFCHRLLFDDETKLSNEKNCLW